MARKQYDMNFKQMIVELNQNGQTTASLSREYGITESMIYKWKKQLTPTVQADGSTMNPTDVKRLQKQIDELKMENEILKKAVAIFASPPNSIK
jgi:transposase